MPLKHGKSEKAFKQNIKTEMEHGKPQKQALAIAYAVKRRAQRKAKGGIVEPEQNVSKPYKGQISEKEEHQARQKAIVKSTEEALKSTSNWSEMNKKREPILETKHQQELQKLRKQKGTKEYSFPHSIGMSESSPDYPKNYAKGGLIPGVEQPHEGEPMNKKLHPCAHGGPVHCNMGCYAEGTPEGPIEQPKPESSPESSEEAKPGMRERIGRALDAIGSSMSGSERIFKVKPKLDQEKVKKFQESKPFGMAEGGMVDDEEIEGEGHSHTMRPDYAGELEDEPMGNAWHSDEFLADPYGEMTANHHVEFDPDVEAEEGEHDEMKPNPKKRLETIMARRRVQRLSKKD